MTDWSQGWSGELQFVQALIGRRATPWETTTSRDSAAGRLTATIEGFDVTVAYDAGAPGAAVLLQILVGADGGAPLVRLTAEDTPPEAWRLLETALEPDLAAAPERIPAETAPPPAAETGAPRKSLAQRLLDRLAARNELVPLEVAFAAPEPERKRLFGR